MELRLGKRQLRLCLIALCGGVARVDNHQQIAFFHPLVIFHAQFRDIPRHFRRDGHGIAFNKGIVSGFKVSGHKPPDDGPDNHNDNNNTENNQRLFTGALAGFPLAFPLALAVILVFAVIVLLILTFLFVSVVIVVFRHSSATVL